MKRWNIGVLALGACGGLLAGCFSWQVARPGAWLTGLGGLLRALSQSGGWGNALAWAIFAVLGALPMLGLLPVRRRHKGFDALWVAASAYAYVMLFMLVNPHLLRGWLYPDWASGAEMIDMCALLLAGMLLTLLLAAFIMRVIREEGDTKRLLGQAGALLVIFELLAAFAACAALGAPFKLEGTDRVYGVICALCSLASASALIALCDAAKRLLCGLKDGWFRDENARLAENMALWARRMMVVELIAMVLENGLALILGAHLSTTNVNVSLSLSSLLIALAALILARFVRAGINVRQENDQFI